MGGNRGGAGWLLETLFFSVLQYWLGFHKKTGLARSKFTLYSKGPEKTDRPPLNFKRPFSKTEMASLLEDGVHPILLYYAVYCTLYRHSCFRTNFIARRRNNVLNFFVFLSFSLIFLSAIRDFFCSRPLAYTLINTNKFFPASSPSPATSPPPSFRHQQTLHTHACKTRNQPT